MSEPTWTPAPGKVLALRTCTRGEDGTLTSHGGFVWPHEPGAVVEAPDWDPSPKCSHGLHGLLWGMGNPGYLNHGESAYMVVEADEADVVWIQDDKVKFPRCTIVHVGDLPTCARLITPHAPDVARRRAQVCDLSTYEHHAYVLDTERVRPECPHGCDNDYDECPHIPRAEVVEVPVGAIANILSSEIRADAWEKASLPLWDDDDLKSWTRMPHAMHTVMLDLDVRARLVESTSEGHYHLYIDVPMPWPKYKRLLKTLAHVGVIERGYYKAACSRKATFLRLPWVKKPRAREEKAENGRPIPSPYQRDGA